METAKQKILKLQGSIKVLKMKLSNVVKLKRSVTSEKNRANFLQTELRKTRNKLDKYLENSLKQDQDSKMSMMKALTYLQVAAVKESTKLEFTAQSKQMQRRNKKERFSGLHINDLHHFSDIMQQFSKSMGTSFMGRQQSPWQQQSMLPILHDAAWDDAAA